LTTHIIGAGLAGLAAALHAPNPVIYESGPACGGRARSYFDRELGCRIDNGNHLLLSGNRATMAYLDRVGARHTLGGPGAPVFPFIDVRTGTRWTVRPNAGRLPWWVLSSARGVPGARLRDYAALLRLRRAKATDTVGQLLPRNALYSKLLEPLAVSALNTPADEGSARLLWAVVAETLAQGGANCIPCWPKDGLSESFVDPAVAAITQAGGHFRTSHRIASLSIQDGRVTALAGPDGPIDVALGDQVILATPAAVAAGLLSGLRVPDAHEAILNLHFRTDAPSGEAGFIGLVGGLAEWVFVKPGVVSVTISAANRLLDTPADALAKDIWPEVCMAVLQGATTVAEMPPYRLIREKRATFAATPAQQMRRPCATTSLSNLVLAGDWTDTGLPATIEGAIRSGFAAAHHVTAGQAAT
jgi:squalene-associated FAD-dependent desaturase